MTANDTISTEPVPTAPVTAPRKSRKIALIITGALVFLAAFGIIGAVNSHPAAAPAAPRVTTSAPAASAASAPAPAPATADAVLSADGYALVEDMPAADIAGTSGMITSAAVGSKSDGTIELAVVASNPGTAGLFAGVMQPSGDTSGATVTASGNIVRITGTMAQIDALASSTP